MSVDIVERSTNTHNISDKAVQKCLCEVLFHDNTKDVELVQIRPKVIMRLPWMCEWVTPP